MTVVNTFDRAEQLMWSIHTRLSVLFRGIVLYGKPAAY